MKLRGVSEYAARGLLVHPVTARGR